MRIPLSCVLLFSVACAGGDSEKSTLNSSRDSAGITIVENVSAEWERGGEWQIGAQPVLVLDNATDLDNTRFVMSGLRRDDGGIVILTDAGGFWFDSTGTLVHRIAGTGEGPGEFRYTSGLLSLGDSIAVYAGGYRARVAVYGPDGALVREFVPASDKLTSWRWAECGRSDFLPDMSSLQCIADDKAVPEGEHGEGAEEGWIDPGPGLYRRFTRVVVIPPTRDTIYPLGRDGGIEQFGVAGTAGRTEFIVHPFHSRSHVVAGGSPARIAIVTNPEYEIQLWTPTGKLDRVIRRAGAREIPSRDDAARANALMLARSRTPEERERQQRLMDAVPVPDSLPAAFGLVLGREGHVYMRRTPYFADDIPTRYDVFDAEGAWLGALALPRRFSIMEVGENYILGARLNDDDVVSVELLELNRQPGMTRR